MPVWLTLFATGTDLDAFSSTILHRLHRGLDATSESVPDSLVSDLFDRSFYRRNQRGVVDHPRIVDRPRAQVCAASMQLPEPHSSARRSKSPSQIPPACVRSAPAMGAVEVNGRAVSLPGPITPHRTYQTSAGRHVCIQ